MSFEISSILHASVIVSNLEGSLHFYCDVLGLSVNPARPDLGYPGAWLIVGEQEIHLLQLPNPDPVDGRPIHGGRDRHVALSVSNMAELKARLDDNDFQYTSSKSGRQAVFLRDPDGNTIEFIA